MVQTVIVPSGAPQAWRIATLDLPGWSGPNRPPTDITGSFTEIPRAHAFKMDVRPGSFSDSLFVAGATQTRIRVVLYERPPVSAHAGPAQALTGYPLGEDPPLVDGPFSLTYADPFPAWTKVVDLTALELLPIAIPGMSATTAPFGMRRTIDFTSATTAPLAVALSPPQAPRVGGAAPFAAATGVSTTPRIEWSAPKYRPTGTIRYVVAIGEVCAHACPSTGGVTIWTTATSVVVPAEFLTPGKVYTASVGAEWTGGTIDFAAHPLDGDVIERAFAPTGGFTP